MNINYPSDAELLRAEIAAAAARMIAEDGADYGTAKRKAARLILGNQRVRGDVLPDNAQIEAEVREYQALFQGDEQSQRLLHLRRLALEVMEKFEDFAPYVTGAVLNGTASEHSDIHLQLFARKQQRRGGFFAECGHGLRSLGNTAFPPPGSQRRDTVLLLEARDRASGDL